MWFDNPLFGLVLTIALFLGANKLYTKSKIVFLNPLLVTISMILAVLIVLDIPLESYQKGGSIISTFVKPATVALAIPLYKNFEVLRKNFLPVIVGVTTGVAISLISILMITRLFGFDEVMTASLMSKSITAAIGIGVTKQIGGIIPIAIACTVFTGICGNMLGPIILRSARIKNKTAMGIAFGTSSHVIGTSRAISMGEEIGAMSAVAIPIAGLITVIIAPTIFELFI